MLAVGKFWGYRYTDDSAMTLAMANSLIRQPAAAADVYLFDAKDMANGYSVFTYFFLLLWLNLVFVIQTKGKGKGKGGPYSRRSVGGVLISLS